MFFSPLKYEEPLFRPPSEAYSLILQVTFGCTWNKCSFCEMYTSKKFRIKKEDEIIREIESVALHQKDVRKVFLADGNAMVLSTERLLKILTALRTSFPKLQRVSAYALPGDINSKSPDELRKLREAGLKLIYVGIESGDNELLAIINKGETYESTVSGLIKAHDAGIKSSVMILLGLGGKKYSNQHAINSALVLNATQPHFASTLILSFPFGVEHYKKRFNGEYIEMKVPDLLKELKTFIAGTDLNGTIFRSDHASNYLILKGILSRDKAMFLEQIEHGQNNPSILREEWMRGL